MKHFPALEQAGHVYVAMPPLFRVDVGKKVHYVIDESELNALLEKLSRDKVRGKPDVTRFKGLGEMNPSQLRETTINPDSRKLVQLYAGDAVSTAELMDMLLAKKRASDRKEWLERKGDMVEVV